MRWAFSTVAALMLLPGCTWDTKYPCTGNAQCSRDGMAGYCLQAPSSGSYCVFADPLCNGGLRWDSTASSDVAGLCAVTSCSDGQLNGLPGALETDIDCGGGMCPKCADGKRCGASTDCASGKCTSKGVCRAAGCDDGVKNGVETDVDCGFAAKALGLGCTLCAISKGCLADADCDSAHCSAGACRSCADGAKNGLETGTDCGGAAMAADSGCQLCPVGQGCTDGSDCASGHCYNSLCFDCYDGKRDGNETDVDCGGSCAPCRYNLGCVGNADCASGLCNAVPDLGTPDAGPFPMSCALSPTCSDKKLDGHETDVDCGGDCPLCGDGRACTNDADCVSRKCPMDMKNDPLHYQRCTSTCYDAIQNGGESDVDCGGNCASCPEGKHCRSWADCATHTCIGLVCTKPVCGDGAKDGDESDVDCGGATCTPCALGKNCFSYMDCDSKTCTNGICAKPACQDGVKNNNETDIDCGGPVCAPCGPTKQCLKDSDCVSTYCRLGLCTI